MDQLNGFAEENDVNAVGLKNIFKSLLSLSNGMFKKKQNLVKTVKNLNAIFCKKASSNRQTEVFVVAMSFHIFTFFRTTGPISTKLGTKHPGLKFVQMKGSALFQEEIITNQ